MSHQNIKNIVARVDKSKKYLYNFIVINKEKIRIDIYIYLKARGGIQDGTTKKKMVKS